MFLTLAVLALTAGMALGLSWPDLGLATVVGPLGGLGLVLAFRRRGRRFAAVCVVAATGFGAGRGAARPLQLAPPVVEAVARGAPVMVEGEVQRLALGMGLGPSPARAALRLSRVAGVAAKARLWLLLPADAAGLGPGDIVRLRVRIDVPTGLANPDSPDSGLRARAQGIELVAALGAPRDVVVLARGRWYGPRRIAHRLHQALAEVVDRDLPARTAALLRGLVLGERMAAGEAVEEGFRAAGATHALSVSGLHLTAVAGLVFFLFKRGVLLWPWLALRCRPDRVAAAIAVPAVSLYALLTGEAVATMRAALMAGVVFGAVLFRRSFSLGPSVALAALTLLLSTPLLLLDISFQLSFASVAALGLAARSVLRGRPAAGGLWARAWAWVRAGLLATLAATVVTGPLVAHHFAELSPAAPVGNLVLGPLVELGVVPTGLLGCVLGAVHPWLGFLPLTVADYLGRGVLLLAEGFRRFAPVVPLRSPNVLETVALVTSAFLSLIALGRERRRLPLAVAGLALGVGVISLAAREVSRRYQEEVRVTFLDVGQGDAILVEGPGGFTALVDGGGNARGGFDPGARVIEPLLRRRGVGRLDLVALSHPHPDHMNGLRRIIDRFSVDTLWTSGDRGGNPAYDALVTAARARGVRQPRPATMTLGGLTIEPLGPWDGGRIGAAPGLGVNDASLVLRLRFAGRTVLLTGDIEEQGEAELVARNGARDALQVDVLKAPHHGSRTSSSDELLDATRPGTIVISLGRRNRFGFPHPEVLARYQRRGTRVLRTDESGAVTITITPAGQLHATWVRGCR